MTEQEVVTELVNEFRGSAPTAAQVLIDERDAYLQEISLRLLRAEARLLLWL